MIKQLIGYTVVAACVGAAMVSCTTLGKSRQKSSPRLQSEPFGWPISRGDKPVAGATAPNEALKPPSEAPKLIDQPGVQSRKGRAHNIEFLEVILGAAQFDDPLPLVVLIHGRGDRPRVPGGPFAGVPTAMRVVLPQGPRRLGKGFSWLPVSITHGKLDVLTKALEKRAHHLAAFIDWVQHNRPTLGKPIVSGFSQGGMLTFALASLRPDMLAAAFPLAGWLPPALLPTVSPLDEQQRVRIRAAHGDADRIVPVEPTRKVVNMLQALGWDAQLDVFAGLAHVVDKRMNARFEDWLEAAVRDQAPDLQNGLGSSGPEPQAYDDVEPLEDATVEAMLEEEAGGEASDVDPSVTEQPETSRPDAEASELDPAESYQPPPSGVPDPAPSPTP